MDWRSLMSDKNTGPFQVKFVLKDGTEIETMNLISPPHISGSFVKDNKRYLIKAWHFDGSNRCEVEEVPLEYGKLSVTIPTPNPEETTKKDDSSS